MTGDRLREPTDVDALSGTITRALAHLRFSNAQSSLSKSWEAKEARAALRLLVAQARPNADRDRLLADAIDALERAHYHDIARSVWVCIECEQAQGKPHEDGCPIGALLARFRQLGDTA